MLKLIIIYLQKHWDDVSAITISGVSLGLLMTEISTILKILVAAATLVYYIIKIYKLVKKK